MEETNTKNEGQELGQELRPVILITGCGSGIGLALADLLYLYDQYRVCITARGRSLEFLKGAFVENKNFIIRPLDVTSAEQRQALVEEVSQKWGGVNVLVNNAGISYRSVVEHMDEKDEMSQLMTNYLAPMALTRLVLPFMRRKGRGKIINVSSVSGMLAMPTMASYSASKYALEGASEALWYEMRPLGVNVTLVQPGFIRSNSFQRVYYSDASRKAEKEGGEYSDYYRNMAPFVGKMMNSTYATPDTVAQKIINVIQKPNPPLRVLATLDALLFYYIRRWTPRRLLQPFLFSVLPNAPSWGKSYSNARALKGSTTPDE